MKVVLPGSYTGQTIVDAFRHAGMIEESSEMKWHSVVEVGEYHYKGAPSHTIRSIGVIVTPWRLSKKGLFSKEREWKDEANPRFTLQPVVLDNVYAFVEVAVEYRHNFGTGGSLFVARTPHDHAFEHIRPYLEEILARFFYRLETFDSLGLGE